MHSAFSVRLPSHGVRIIAQHEREFSQPFRNIVERAHPLYSSYVVVGSSGTVRGGDINRSSRLTASAFDLDLAFLAAEIGGDTMSFNVISRAGQTVDTGRVTRRK